MFQPSFFFPAMAKLNRNDCIYDDFYSYIGKSVPLSSYVTLQDLFVILWFKFLLCIGIIFTILLTVLGFIADKKKQF